ncbi:MAG TPA: cytochrome C [Ferrovibrio sp.]|uniref:c-type cytochrome n=1 Tax=Ferrovibrio sp. TaxID=1917215 RepID=UPI002ED0A921
MPVAILLCLSMLSGCDKPAQGRSGAYSAADAISGKLAIYHYGCPTCHRIPGIAGANASVGPSLERMAERQYIAGILANRPDNMVAWLLDPPSLKSATAMPKLGMPRRDAEDIAAYLYTLRR